MGVRLSDLEYMRLALAQAHLALDHGEIPVGAIIIDEADGRIVGQGCNLTLSTHDPTAHAEIVALRSAGMGLANYRLPELSMYVTLEPCCMCSGALIHARLKRLVYGAPDPRTGACGSVFSVLTDPRHNHKVEVTGGILAEESGELLREFFRARRREQKLRLPKAQFHSARTSEI